MADRVPDSTRRRTNGADAEGGFPESLPGNDNSTGESKKCCGRRSCACTCCLWMYIMTILVSTSAALTMFMYKVAESKLATYLTAYGAYQMELMQQQQQQQMAAAMHNQTFVFETNLSPPRIQVAGEAAFVDWMIILVVLSGSMFAIGAGVFACWESPGSGTIRAHRMRAKQVRQDDPQVSETLLVTTDFASSESLSARLAAIGALSDQPDASNKDAL